jgi:hypothetical protein
MPTISSWKNWIWRWIIACVATQLVQIFGDGLASWMSSAISFSKAPGAPSLIVVIAVFRLFSGALGGVAQGLVLGSRFPFIGNWVIATSLGSAVAFILVNGLYFATPIPSTGHMIQDAMPPPRSVLPQFIFASLTGLILGVAQWFALRGHVLQAGWWVLLSVAGLVTADICVGLLQRFVGTIGLDVSTGVWNPVFWGISGFGIAPYAIITSRFWVRRLGERF